MALQAVHRSPPDGKSSPPGLSDTSVIIPGFLSKSSQLNLAMPAAALPLTRTPKPAPRNINAAARPAKGTPANWQQVPQNFTTASLPSGHENLYNEQLSSNHFPETSSQISPVYPSNGRPSPDQLKTGFPQNRSGNRSSEQPSPDHWNTSSPQSRPGNCSSGQPSPDHRNTASPQSIPGTRSSGQPSPDHWNTSSPQNRPGNRSSGQPSPDHRNTASPQSIPGNRSSGQPSPDYRNTAPQNRPGNRSSGQPSPDHRNTASPQSRPGNRSSGQPSPDYRNTAPQNRPGNRSSGQPSPDHRNTASPQSRPGNRSSGQPSPDHRNTSYPQNRPGNRSSGQPSPDHWNTASPQSRPGNRSSGQPSPDGLDTGTAFPQSRTQLPKANPKPVPAQRLVSTPVSGVIQTTRSGSVHGTRKVAKALHISEVSGETRSVAKPATERIMSDSPLEQVTPKQKEDSAPLSPVSPTSLTHRAAPDIPPYFIHPLNLCDPFVDDIGLMEICSLRVDELQYLSQTNQNTPITLKDGRTVPSFLVRIWSRGSGRYLDILSVGELYGRGLFGHNERLRLVVVGHRTVMIQSTNDSRLHISIQNGVVTGKGDGGQDCHFILHQGPTGYCLLESLLSPGHFLGVRKNGNIMRPSMVNPSNTEARFVIQKETLGALM